METTYKFYVERYGESRYFAVYDQNGELVCVTVYKIGAKVVVRRLEELVCKVHEKEGGEKDEEII